MRISLPALAALIAIPALALPYPLTLSGDTLVARGGGLTELNPPDNFLNQYIDAATHSLISVGALKPDKTSFEDIFAGKKRNSPVVDLTFSTHDWLYFARVRSDPPGTFKVQTFKYGMPKDFLHIRPGSNPLKIRDATPHNVKIAGVYSTNN